MSRGSGAQRLIDGPGLVADPGIRQRITGALAELARVSAA